ncbi:MAG: aldo/keto reductase [Alphaproteobacteria bacterium]|nr:aldo/keto reductase [Alphaproteobacteria bacterium]
MLYRTLGRTGQKVSLLSYGSGGPSQFGARTGVDRAGRRRLIRRMLDLGVNLFDTAEGYGNSEEWLGDALQGADRDSYLIATKWGPPGTFRVGDEDNFTGLAESFERSLRRLKTDYIDVMQFHGVNMTTYGAAVDRYYPILKGLQEQGKLRFIGATFQLKAEPRHETAVHALRSDPDLWDTIMLKYGFLNQWAAKEVFPLAIEHGVGVLNMAAVRISLTRPQRSREVVARWKEEGLIGPDDLPDDGPFDWLIGDDADSVISAGYKFGADHPAVSTVITGTSSIEHFEANARSLEKPSLPREHHERLVRLFGDSAEPD